jgi:hypothetical protein
MALAGARLLVDSSHAELDVRTQREPGHSQGRISVAERDRRASATSAAQIVPALDPRRLARSRRPLGRHGISIALYNTAFALMIAIPALMFYRYFRGKVDEYILDLEQAAERMVPHLMRFTVQQPQR